ncbi:MAG: hypothetical protein ABUL60_14850 [Myxococcales bacterium]
MAHPKYDPQAMAYAVEAVRAGRSLREIAAELAELDVHVSHETIRGWARRAEQKPPVFTPSPPGAVALEECRTLAQLLETDDLDREGIAAVWAALAPAVTALLESAPAGPAA